MKQLQAQLLWLQSVGQAVLWNHLESTLLHLSPNITINGDDVKSDESGKEKKERVYLTIVNVKVFLIK